MGGATLFVKNGGVWTTVRNPVHVRKLMEDVIEKTGTKKLHVEKIVADAEHLFTEHKLLPTMHVRTSEDDGNILLTGKHLDYLGGYLESDIFEGKCTGDDEWTIPVQPDVYTDLKELCSEWGWKYNSA